MTGTAAEAADRVTGDAKARRHGVALLVAASIARYSGQLAVFVVLTRTAGAADAGLYAVALATAAPVFLVADMGLKNLWLTLDHRLPFAHYEAVRLVSALAAVAVVTATAGILGGALALLLAVSVQKASDASAELCSGALQSAGAYRSVLLGSSGAAAAQVGAAVVVGLATSEAALTVGASALAHALVTAGPVRVAARRAARRDPRPTTTVAVRDSVRRVVAAGVPAGAFLALAALVTTVPQYALGLAGHWVEAGTLSLLLYVVAAVQIVLSASAQAWLPTARQLLRGPGLGPAAVLVAASRWARGTVPSMALGLVAAHLLLGPLLGRPLDVGLATAVPLLVVAVVAPVVFAASAALSVHNRYVAASLAALAELGPTVALAAALVPGTGLVGALWSYASGVAAQAAALLVALLAGRRRSARVTT